ncbi:hypothetical protein [Amycolatopsis sp. NPDC049159]|uniref:hypothetical protein n=1 Tax=unclassified Amycolatopsis TaxID=2618356 RepID=UPI0033E8E538
MAVNATRIAVAALVLLGATACGIPVTGVPVPVTVVPQAPVTSTATVAVPAPVYVQPPVSLPPRENPGAAATVIAYYDAINRRDFATAWSLGGSRIAGGGGYTKYAGGFATTAWDTLTVTDIRGSTVHVVLSAAQTDGTTRTFSGTYTVSGGVIVGSHMTRTG